MTTGNAVKSCGPKHRYLFHQARRISPAEFDERVRTIVRDELDRLDVPFRKLQPLPPQRHRCRYLNKPLAVRGTVLPLPALEL